jgi:hypothetical protein
VPRDYGKLRHRYWTGDTGRQIRGLGWEAQLVGAYLCTCGSSNMIGIYYLPLQLIAHETAVKTLEGASKALRRLSEVGFAYYDESTETVFVPNLAREQIAESLEETDNRRKGVIELLSEYKKSRFVADFVGFYKDAYKLPDYLASKPLRSPFEAPLKPGSGSGEQEQEQKHEHTFEPPKGDKRSLVITSEAFTQFWTAYPRKTGKGQAAKAWPGDELLQPILDALAWQVPTWKDPQYIKHPATWLRARCWEDERPEDHQGERSSNLAELEKYKRELEERRNGGTR